MLAKLITLQNTSLGQCSLFSFFIFFYLYSLNNATEFNSVGTIKTTVHNVPQKYASCFVRCQCKLLCDRTLFFIASVLSQFTQNAPPGDPCLIGFAAPNHQGRLHYPYDIHI